MKKGIDPSTGDITDADYAKDEYLNSLSKDQRKNLVAEEEKYITELSNKHGTSTNGWLVRYVKNTTSGDWTPYFVNKDILTAKGMVYDDSTLNTLSAVTTYTIGSAKETEEIPL